MLAEGMIQFLGEDATATEYDGHTLQEEILARKKARGCLQQHTQHPGGVWQ